MQFYPSMKWLPEIRHRSWKDRRQALWQAGFKPYRSWRFWLALVLSALAVLWGIDLVLGLTILDHAFPDSNRGLAGMASLLLVICIPPWLACRSSYIKAMRPHISRAKFDPAARWYGVFFKGLLPDLLFLLVFVLMVALLDMAINGYDAAPDPRFVQLQKWPEPIADANNGFIAAAGLMAPAGASPFEAGRRWVESVNAAMDKQSHDFPKAPAGLKYAAYVPPVPEKISDSGRTGPYAQFCLPTSGVCVAIVQQEQKAVEAWLAANQELLARYLTLQKYLGWQYALKPGDSYMPIIPLSALLHAQSLMHASILLAFEKKQPGKGLDMLGEDIRFVRNMLGSKDGLAGKMNASTMLAGDLALLAELIEQRPNDLRPYWEQIEKMVEPLTAAQVSVADAFRFDERVLTARMSQFSSAPQDEDGLRPGLTELWSDHHVRRNASVKLMLDYWEQVLRLIEVRDPAYTPPLQQEDISPLQAVSTLTGFMHNQVGKILILVTMPEYPQYANRLYELNAFNSLVHLRLTLARDNVDAGGVPAYLARNDKSLLNPETGKPFEWDAAQRQVYFTPATASFENLFTPSGATPGRVAVTVPAPAGGPAL